MATFSDIKNQLSLARQQQEQAEQSLYAGRQALAFLEKQLNSLLRLYGNGQLPGGQPQKLPLQVASCQLAMKNERKKISTFTAQVAAAIQQVKTLEAQLVALGSSQTLVNNNLSDDYPVLLFPIRIESRFMKDKIVQLAPDSFPPIITPTDELWLRFFPDDVHIESHEPELTPDEREAGRTFWTAIWTAQIQYAFDAGVKQAWRAVCASFGVPRAGWIIDATRPANFDTWNTNFSNPPVHPVLTPKTEAWTRAPRVRIMPERFVVRLYTNDTTFREVEGNMIPFPLIVGPDPALAENSFTEDKVMGHINVDPAIKWMTDFPEAVAVGMGMKIILTPTEANGLQKIVVLGVRVLDDANTTAKDRLQSLINSHRFSPGGFSLVRQGTPTNTTKEGPGFPTEQVNDVDAALERILPNQSPAMWPLFTTVEKWDADWLAEALGIDSDPLRLVPNHLQTDVSDAVAMNFALFPATLGYYLEQMLDTSDTGQKNPWIPADQIQPLRVFFSRYISGRGFVPSFRTGRQPYGILPATVYSRLNFSVTNLFEQIAGRIQVALKDFALKTARARLNQIPRVGKANSNWQQTFIDILGLHPSSVEFYQQYLFGPVLYQRMAMWLNRPQDFVNTQNQATAVSTGFFQKPLPAQIMRSGSWGNPRKLMGSLVDRDPVSETAGLSSFFEGGNYINWLVDSPLDAIRDQLANSQRVPYTTLLYMLLRHAYLLESWALASQILSTNAVNPDQAYVKRTEEPEFFNIKKPANCTATRWDYLFFKSDQADYKFFDRKFFLQGGQEMAQLLSQDDFRLQTLYPQESGVFLTHKAALRWLSYLSTARLERCMTEHLDLCAYRVDAWQTGLAYYKLDHLRQKNALSGDYVRGAYLGAYGWLLDLKPTSGRQPVPDAQVPDAFKTSSSTQPLSTEPGNAGFIHAPSPRQAVTGALLRSGYLARGRKNMEVNLSSRRVRQALEVVEGLQNGLDLGTLLGYRIERSIKDSNPAFSLRHKLIFQMRRTFPVTAGKNLSPNAPAQEGSTSVIDGLAFVGAMRKNQIAPLFANWTPALAAADKNTADAILLKEAKNTEDLLDAVADLCMAEGIYQAVGGNYERANAVLNAQGDGKRLPDPEFIRTPRTGTTLTHRLGILFQPVQINAAKPRLTPMPWVWQADASASPRALAEPSFNQWLGAYLGSPDAIVCKVTWRVPGVKLPKTGWISAKALHLQPLDLLYAFGDSLDNKAGLAPALVRQYLWTVENVTDLESIKIDFYDRVGIPTTPACKTFGELWPLIRLLKRQAGQARALDAQDFTLPNEEPNALEAAKKWNYQELLLRVKTGYNLLTAYQVNFTTQNLQYPNVSPGGLAYIGYITGVELNLRSFALEYGEEVHVPVFGPAVGNEGRFKSLKEKLESALKSIANKIGAAKQAFEADRGRFTNVPASFSFNDLMAQTLPLTGLNPLVPVDTLVALLKAFVGNAVPVFPLFQLKNEVELGLAFQNRSLLLQNTPAGAFDDWLSGLAKVRPNLKPLHLANLLRDAFQLAPQPKFQPMQLPAGAGDRWIALSGAQEYTPNSISLAFQLPAGFDPAVASVRCGMLLDSWTEIIPSKQETTGIAFHYDGPQTEPPQTLLLAVSPQTTGKWKWNDLMDTVAETLELAKMRALEPDILASPNDPVTDPAGIGSKFNLLLPGIIAAVSERSDATITLDFNNFNNPLP